MRDESKTAEEQVLLVLQKEKEELFEALEMFYQVFVLEEEF